MSIIAMYKQESSGAYPAIIEYRNVDNGRGDECIGLPLLNQMGLMLLADLLAKMEHRAQERPQN